MPDIIDSLPSLASPPIIKVPDDCEVFRVSCPYCLIGHAEVLFQVRRKNGELVKECDGIRNPRQCVGCKKWFKLKTRVVLEGVRLEA